MSKTVAVDLCLIAIVLASGLLLRYRFGRNDLGTTGLEFLKKNRHFILRLGLVVFWGAFAWCLAALALGLSSVGIVLVPTILVASVGWAALSMSSRWMQANPWWIVMLGAAGIGLTVCWLFISAETLSQFNAHNFYWIFYPAIAAITYSGFALTWPALRWLFRSAGLIKDE